MKLKIAALAFLFNFCLSICCARELKSGDLLFVVENTDSDFSNAISNSTNSGKKESYIHVGILEITEQGDSFVIEADPNMGVRRINLDSFLKEAPDINGKPGIIAKRLTQPFSLKKVLGIAKSHIGEEYDWWYLPDNGKLYCSELIYISYLDEDDKNIFPASPMNFRAPDGSMPEFWTNLFNKLGTPIPEGEPGTNPNDMAASSLLVEIHRFF